MQVYNNKSNVNFKQLFPTRELFKVATGIQNVEDSKNICMAYSNKFVGNIGYYKTALKIVKSILQKNKDVKEIAETINLQEPSKKLENIEKYVNQIGSHIDIEV